MATYTITTPINIDTLVAKTGADTYNINWGYLTIDQDSRYGTNQNTSASIGSITLSATLWGIAEINATKVRLIPYNTGTGLVPAYNTTISQWWASGLLIWVYSALNVAPTTPWWAMPVSWFIKIKQWNEVAYTAGLLTWIVATATGADDAGWIELVWVDSLTFTGNRLNDILLKWDYYNFMGVTTTGSNASTYQIPSNWTLVYMWWVWVETDVPWTYEFYDCAWTLPASSVNIVTDSVRGKVCWIGTDWLLRFWHDGVNSTGGFVPPAWRKLRIGNIFLNCCTAAAPTVNVLPSATLTTRYEFSTAWWCAIDVDKVMCNWYMNSVQAYDIKLNNSSFTWWIIISKVATHFVFDDIHVWVTTNQSNTPLTTSFITEWWDITNSSFIRSNQTATNTYSYIWVDSDSLNFTNCKFISLVKSTQAAFGSMTIARLTNSSLTNCTLWGGRVFASTLTNFLAQDTLYFDNIAWNTLAAIPTTAFDFWSNSLNCVIDGISFGGLKMTQPYGWILNVWAAWCSQIFLRNIGTYASPLSLGKERVDLQPRTRVTTVATVTSVWHWFVTGNTIFVVVSSDTGTITVSAKTITSTPTADTFTFTCLNAWATSGTISYFGTCCLQLFTLSAAAAANWVYIQRCYAPHTRSNLYTADNSSTNLVLENVFSDYLNVPTFPVLNMKVKNVSGTPTYTAQTAVYGTHRLNGYVCDVATNTTAQSRSRTTTTATITSNWHNLRTWLLINVTTTSDGTAVRLWVYTVTVLTSNTFNITCLNAGGTTGTIDYRVANGRIWLMMNEATALTTDQYTIDSGNPLFTSLGSLFMPTVGDQITYIAPDYVIWQGSSFPIFEPIMAGGTLTNYEITYSIDKNDGTWFGTFKNLSYPRAGATGTTGLFVINMTSTTGVAVNDYVFGTNVWPNARVVSIDSGTSITVTNANIGTVSGTLRFNQLPSETGIDPQLGIKFKRRIRTAIANVTAITSLYIQWESTVIGRAYQYPLTTANATYSFSWLVAGTEVVLFNSSNVEIDRQTIAGTTYEYDYIWNSNDGDSTGNYALIWKDDKQPIKFESITLWNTNINIPISQQDDLVYNGTYSSISTINYASKLQILTTQDISIQVLYSERKDNILLTNNAQYDFAYRITWWDIVVWATSIPEYVFQINWRKIRPMEANGTTNMTDWIIVAESGDPFVNTLGAYTVRINYQNPVQAITVNTSGWTLTAAQVRIEMDNNSTKLQWIITNTNLIPATV